MIGLLNQRPLTVLGALDPSEEASSEGGGTVVADPEKEGDPEAFPEAPEVEEPHPNSPAHEWCTADCPEDELCARPSEFVVRDENVEIEGGTAS